MPVYENERGTYIFNSKDLCMIEHMDDILASGIDSLKIEGRMKRPEYVAAAVTSARQALEGSLHSETAEKLVAVFCAVMQVYADVEAVVGRRADVVGHIVEEVLRSTLPQVGEVDVLGGQREAVAAVVDPFGIEAGAFAEVVAH